MRKFIQTVSFLGLALILGGLSANAQSSTTKLDADVPFDFVVGNKTFSSGKYVLRISKAPTGVQLLDVRNAEGEILYLGLLSTNGERNPNAAELKFDRTSGQAVLARIVTADGGYSVAKESSGKLIASTGKASQPVNN